MLSRRDLFFGGVKAFGFGVLGLFGYKAAAKEEFVYCAPLSKFAKVGMYVVQVREVGVWTYITLNNGLDCKVIHARAELPVPPQVQDINIFPGRESAEFTGERHLKESWKRRPHWIHAFIGAGAKS